MRKITIINSKSQSQHVIENSEAITLAELKQEMIANGIPSGDIQDTVFFEGKSRTELKDDNSVLPTNVMYKGAITNDLVFMMTSNNTKIKSGLVDENTPRKTLYNLIKSYNLGDTVKHIYKNNYTQVSNKELCEVINEYEANQCLEEFQCSSNSKIYVENTSDKEEHREKLQSLLNDIINEIFGENRNKCNCNCVKEKLSSKEIDDMFDFVNK